MRVVIADDEAPALARLRRYLAKEDDVEIVGEAADGIEAVEVIVRESPDVVFLDIQMPGANGFDVVRELPAEDRPIVIFVTAFDEHAVKAFEVHAQDYLLKPFAVPRLKAALDLAREALRRGQSEAIAEKLARLLREAPVHPAAGVSRRLIVKDGTKTSIVPNAEVVCLLAEGNYVEVCTTDNRRLLLRETMQGLEARLDPATFFRASRSAMVNLQHVKEIVSEGRSGHLLRMANGEKVHLTNSLEDLQNRLAAI